MIPLARGPSRRRRVGEQQQSEKEDAGHGHTR